MTHSETDSDWKVFRGTRKADGDINRLPPPPAWRDFRDDDRGSAELQQARGQRFKTPQAAIEMVNAALYLRRPLLVTGNPGTGKSSLAYAVAHELKLGAVLKWAINTRTTLKEGLYSYDAIARLQDAKSAGKDNREQVGDYITLGALGTAFLPTNQPRVLLIDEIDKGDIDLPNDLLNLFEDGEFAIPELQRLKISPVKVRTSDRGEGGEQKKESIRNGIVRCRAFPLVIMTSNNERDFPPPFLRRCLRLEMPAPQSSEELSEIVANHLAPEVVPQVKELVDEFYKQSKKGILATDQLLNAVYLLTRERKPNEKEKEELRKRLLQFLSNHQGS
ncbi:MULTISPECIES: AAA family ATPase [Leptolyngbya]|uniref:AAA family ATPase n=1 Tax=Leptolyngbya TaxID=47251 RepID=UPI001685D631|nr:MoxR family ATPase [Leptolyngbya sp. FACHB-1624]MBD1856151.1 AAA family ATPase [Leptolyngbya sp. FACHB-1624]